MVNHPIRGGQGRGIASRKGSGAAAISCEQRVVDEAFCGESFQAIYPYFAFSTAAFHPIVADNRFT